jgi:acetoin utilization protein AcuB
MFVSRSMSRNVITVVRETKVLEAQSLMQRKEIRHLPVVDDDNRLVGIVTDRDIRSALPYDLTKGVADPRQREDFAHLKVGDIMSTDLLPVSPTHTLQDALLLLEKKKVGSLPVVDDDNRIVGIISVRDLLRAFIEVLGIGQPGTLLCILVEEKIGQLKKIVDVIAEEKISCGSVLVVRHWEQGKRAVFPYLLSNNVTRVKKRLQEIGFTILNPLDWNIDRPQH